MISTGPIPGRIAESGLSGAITKFVATPRVPTEDRYPIASSDDKISRRQRPLTGADWGLAPAARAGKVEKAPKPKGKNPFVGL